MATLESPRDCPPKTRYYTCDEQGWWECLIKAEAYDRIVEKFLRLKRNAEFYSTSRVKLAELIEAERPRGMFQTTAGSDDPTTRD